MVKICGIDEAGRGPVIGPMVIAGVLIDEKDEEKLSELGAKDSKLLTPKKREDLFEKIKSAVLKYEIIIVSPKEIDDALESEELNLNWLEAIKSAEIINQLSPGRAIIDSPSNNVVKYGDYIRNLLNKKDTELVVEHKADLNYPCAAAASILAKVTRDMEINKIKQKVGEIGSGYPADPFTRQFLLKNYDKHPKIFRKSWQSYKDVVNQKGQKKLGDY